MRFREWVPAAEIFASIAIAISLIVLILEVRQNTLVQERQIQIDQRAAFNDPFVVSPVHARILAKVKAVDGLEPNSQAYIDRYELTVEEAGTWARHNTNIWSGFQSQYFFSGPTEVLESSLRGIFKYPDAMIVFDINEDTFLRAEFVTYVEFIRDSE